MVFMSFVPSAYWHSHPHMILS